MADVGDYLDNAGWTEIWTCPACMEDHYGEVSACQGCGTPLVCTIEQVSTPRCTIVGAGDEK